jgi:hypothetical protein
MNAKSVKRVFGLAATAAGTGGAMMLAPTVANAATAHPAHAQTVNNVSKVSDGWGDSGGDWGGGEGSFPGGGEDGGGLGLGLGLGLGGH